MDVTSGERLLPPFFLHIPSPLNHIKYSWRKEAEGGKQGRSKIILR
jgi:hypothetical protein